MSMRVHYRRYLTITIRCHLHDGFSMATLTSPMCHIRNGTKMVQLSMLDSTPSEYNSHLANVLNRSVEIWHGF